MCESHGLGSVGPSYVGVVSCVLIGTYRHCGAGVVGVAGSNGGSTLHVGGQVASCYCGGAFVFGATAGLTGSRLAESIGCG